MKASALWSAEEIEWKGSQCLGYLFGEMGAQCWGNVAAIADTQPFPFPASVSAPAARWPGVLRLLANRMAAWKGTVGVRVELQSHGRH